MRYMSPARLARPAIACAAVVATLGLAPLPALALSDSAASSASSLLYAIDDSIPDDATLISEEYALLTTGEVVRTSDGSVVEDVTDILGTEDEPADPLAVTNGERFEAITVGEAREAAAAAARTSLVSLLDFSCDTGSYWSTYNDTPAFYMSNGTMFVCQATQVVDVSEHNGSIDWAAAQADGVEGAIIRIGYGTSHVDTYAAYNISECERLGIPYGIYLYSYSYDADTARSEATTLVSWLQQLGVEPGDLSFPVYYDLENWTWTGHTPPTDPAVYEEIVRVFIETLEDAGYTASVYSYRSYLYGALNTTYIHENTSWVAEYNGTLAYTDFADNFRGWQYTSSGSVAGFAGNVDLSAFGNGTYEASVEREEGCTSVDYTDVEVGAWYHEGVDWAIAQGIMTGYGDQDGVFGVSDALTRAQMARVLWNLAGNPEVDDLSVLDAFTDVDTSKGSSISAYLKAMAWCVEQGYMTGYSNGTFGAADKMTREQLATVLWRVAGEPASSYDLSDYVDESSISSFARAAMRWMVSQGAITGQGNTGKLDPQGDLERCQLAVILMRLYAE